MNLPKSDLLGTAIQELLKSFVERVDRREASHLQGISKQSRCGCFQKYGETPPKWMVKIMENPITMDDLGIPLFLETPIYLDHDDHGPKVTMQEIPSAADEKVLSHPFKLPLRIQEVKCLQS